VFENAKDFAVSNFTRLGFGKLVIAYRKGLTLQKPEEIVRADFKRIGIPDQANAVYGKAGRQFLDRTGLAKEIDPRLVPVATVPQVTSYVVSGDVDAGFVNATDAIGAAGNIGGFVPVDPKLYDPAEISCAIVGTAKPAGAAAAFLAFVETAEARSILTRYGL
jgi:molybdate transport system substrate-binding protein